MDAQTKAAVLARVCAAEAVDAFERYNSEFLEITRRAARRFDKRDWQGSQGDAVERIELYGRYIETTVAALSGRLGERATDRGLWAAIRHEFALFIDAAPDAEFRKTFFNSLTRMFFGTVGVSPELEFVALDLDPLANVADYDFLKVYEAHGSPHDLCAGLLASFRCKAPWRDFAASVREVSAVIERRCLETHERRAIARIEMIRPAFFQITRAYLVGQVVGREWRLPLAVALKNTEHGVVVDAVMTSEAELSVLFSFSRSYFHVNLERVGKALLFLKQLMPQKPVSELFTLIGRAKQGKTERYRELFHHLQTAADKFVPAPGERGLVMVVFTLPSFEVVFKLIRDRFPAQKDIVRADVLRKYEFVFKRDRAGRLVDAQEFKRLRFPRRLFDPRLIEELLSQTAGTVHDDGEHLIIDHCYIERRVTPLNLYLRAASASDAARAVLEYGQAIRDLAGTNIFAGDLLLKNFGVTRHRRVIFYDYDELCLVTDCRFREVPVAAYDEDEMRAETWYYVGEHDVFPETFINFLGFEDALRELFLEAHGELLTAAWWRGMQQRIRAQEVIEVLPYSADRRPLPAAAPNA